MENMVGGQSARGERMKKSSDQPGPVHFLLDSQMSIHGSEQGSFDDPVDETGAVEDYEESSQQTRRRTRTPSGDKGQRSGGTFANSGNSGSKRKSTDEEPSVRGKRYKDKNRRKQTEGKLLADAGFEIANKIAEDTKAFMVSSDEKQACVQKLRDLDFDDDVYDYCLKLLAANDVNRKWFLFNDRETILKLIRKRLRPIMAESIPPPSTYAFNGAYQGFPSPNPAANTASSQFFRPTNPAATNYFFQQNDPSRDGNFL